MKRDQTMSNTLKIGAVSKRTGLSVDAIRFYEKEGLLKISVRSEGGFRLFREKDLEDLRLIRSAQSLGFSLVEIRDLLSIRNGLSTPCADVKRLLERKLAAVQQKISDLNRMEREISTALKDCNRALRSSQLDKKASCPVLIVNRPRAMRKR